MTEAHIILQCGNINAYFNKVTKTLKKTYFNLFWIQSVKLGNMIRFKEHAKGNPFHCFHTSVKGSLTLSMGKCLWFSVKIKVCQSSLSSS